MGNLKKNCSFLTNEHVMAYVKTEICFVFAHPHFWVIHVKMLKVKAGRDIAMKVASEIEMMSKNDLDII